MKMLLSNLGNKNTRIDFMSIAYLDMFDGHKKIKEMRDLIIDVPDFPKTGIMFKDLSLIFNHRLYDATLLLHQMFVKEKYDFIAGIDARGFILGAAMAMQTGKSFLPIRKKDKLPGKKCSITATTEYSEIALEVKHFDETRPTRNNHNRVLVIDDVLATGGTFKAAGDLLLEAGYRVVGFGALIDLLYLNEFDYQGIMKCRSLIQYNS